MKQVIGDGSAVLKAQDLFHGKDTIFIGDIFCCSYCAKGKTFAVMGCVDDLDIVDRRAVSNFMGTRGRINAFTDNGKFLRSYPPACSPNWFYFLVHP
jgi:hypothetical protein